MSGSFSKNEAGAVTVDWVVLTAALVGLGLATMSVVGSGVESLSTSSSQAIASAPIRTTFTSFTLSAATSDYNANGTFGAGIADLHDIYGIDWETMEEGLLLATISNGQMRQSGLEGTLQLTEDFRLGAATWQDFATLYGSSATSEAAFLAEQPIMANPSINTMQDWVTHSEEDTLRELYKLEAAIAEADRRNLTY